MTVYTLSLKKVVFLRVALENPKIKGMYDNLVKNYIEISGETEDEAKRAIFPEFLAAIKELANKS